MQTSPARSLAILLSFCASLHFATSASAAVVTNTTQAALASALAGGGTVTFGVDGTFMLTNTLVIARDVTVDGSGHAIAINGSNAVRIFLVNPGINFTLKNLSVVNGKVAGTNGGNWTTGAGIYNNVGTIAAINCVFSNNAVVGNNVNQPAGMAAGGALYNRSGTLNISNCTFLTNTVTGGSQGGGGYYTGSGLGGAIYSQGGSVNLNGNLFYANGAFGGRDAISSSANGYPGSGFGGAVYTSNAVTLVMACRFANNNAVASVYVTGSDEIGGVGAGGAICQIGGSLTMLQTDVATNSAVGGYVGWYSSVGGNACGGGLFNSGILNVTDSTFTGNHVTGGFYGNPAGDGDGGGLFNGGLATIANCSITGNGATGGNAGQSYMPDGSTPPGQALGAGIYNSNSLVLIGSTLASNTALGGETLPYNFTLPIPGGPGAGGGVYNAGVCHATNNTLIGNSATGGVSTEATGATGAGGAFYNNSGTIIISFQTIFGNSAVAGTNIYVGTNGLALGGGICATNGTVTLYNSIVASNSSGGDFYVISNAVTDGGNNISSDNSFPFTMSGSHNNLNPLLGPLANNGGPSLTMALLPGSPAIGAASSASTTPFDQRGLGRPYNSADDIGAFEYFPAYTIQGTVQHAPANQPVTVATGIFSTTTDAYGNYTLNSVPVGLYSVTPSAAGYIFVPASQSVVLGMNASNVNFAAYQLNALTLESYSNPVLRIAYAGTNGQSAVVQSSGTLSNWVPILTNIVGTNGIFEFQVTNTPGQPIQFFRAHSP